MQVWRCANQQAAVNLTASGMSGKLWLAEFDVGITYPSNANVPFCQGKVWYDFSTSPGDRSDAHECDCSHEDDIYAVFATGINLDASQQSFTNELGARWAAFTATGSPNANGYVQWNPVANANDIELLMINDGVPSSISTSQRPAECSSTTGIWGRSGELDAPLRPSVDVR